MNKNKNKHLFTLLEVLVSMGVFSLLMLALMQFFSAAQGVWEKSGSKSELFDSARTAAQLLTDDLTSAFYGDMEHVMGDEAGKYIFFKNAGSRLTFATQRGGDKGLTEVDYNWNTADLTLEIRERSESEADSPLGAEGWVTFPSNKWINDASQAVRKKDAATIAENVLYFSASNFYYNNSASEPNTDAKYRPPAIVLVTLAVLSSAGYEKLEPIIKSTLPDKTVNKGIIDYFNAMAPVSSSGVREKFSDTAVPESGSDKPAKEIIFDNVQFFKLIIPIER